ncbi:MAG: SCP2 sterol-binding domain-containing protein [Nitrospinota bacterium]|nr:SCP2 sterol-binding domain-containing protein [Nitrospinota bacterium]
MSQKFPSDGWTQSFGRVINASADYKQRGKNWRAGAVSFIVTAAPEIGMTQDFGMFLDLHEGECRSARSCTLAEAEKAPFMIRAEYGWWKSVIRGSLEPVRGLITGKLKLKGDLTVIVRHIGAAKSLAECAAQVDTIFQDEA